MLYKEDPLYLELSQDRDWLIGFRRDLHKYPELSECEFKTQEKIISALNDMGINNYPSASTGVCGVLIGKNDDMTIGLRADIDALPITEMNDLDYKSTYDGVMHACGHDAHTTIQLGVAKYFARYRETLGCNLKFFFQPAEETIGGAARMVEEGVMTSPNVDYVLGLHVMPYLPVGKIEIRDGKLNAASDTFSITIGGKSAHGAYPEQGVDAIVIAAQVILGIQTLVSRSISPLDQAVITVGKINGGQKDNIICDEVTLTGGMRTTDELTRALLKEKMACLVTSICGAFGATGQVHFEEGYKALINDNEVVKVLREVTVAALGRDHVIEKEHPSLGVEDFSYFLDQSKGAFYHLGCGFENGPLGALHTKDFIIDEESLVLGVYLQIKMIEALIKSTSRG
jgi:amidohydrolase